MPIENKGLEDLTFDEADFAPSEAVDMLEAGETSGAYAWTGRGKSEPSIQRKLTLVERKEEGASCLWFPWCRAHRFHHCWNIKYSWVAQSLTVFLVLIHVFYFMAMSRFCKAQGLSDCFRKDNDGKAVTMLVGWIILSAIAKTVVDLLLWHYLFEKMNKWLATGTWVSVFTVNLFYNLVYDMFNDENGYENARVQLCALAVVNALLKYFIAPIVFGQLWQIDEEDSEHEGRRKGERKWRTMVPTWCLWTVASFLSCYDIITEGVKNFYPEQYRLMAGMQSLPLIILILVAVWYIMVWGDYTGEHYVKCCITPDLQQEDPHYILSKDPGWMLCTVICSVKLMNLIVSYYMIYNEANDAISKYAILVAWIAVSALVQQMWIRMSLFSLTVQDGYFINYCYVFSFAMVDAIMFLKWPWPGKWFIYMAFDFVKGFCAQSGIYYELMLIAMRIPNYHPLRKAALNEALAFCSVYVFGAILSRLIMFVLMIMEPTDIMDGDSVKEYGGAFVVWNGKAAYHAGTPSYDACKNPMTLYLSDYTKMYTGYSAGNWELIISFGALFVSALLSYLATIYYLMWRLHQTELALVALGLDDHEEQKVIALKKCREALKYVEDKAYMNDKWETPIPDKVDKIYKDLIEDVEDIVSTADGFPGGVEVYMGTIAKEIGMALEKYVKACEKKNVPCGVDMSDYEDDIEADDILKKFDVDGDGDIDRDDLLAYLKKQKEKALNSTTESSSSRPGMSRQGSSGEIAQQRASEIASLNKSIASAGVQIDTGDEVYQNMSKKQFERCLHLFELIDKDDSGTLEGPELLEFFRAVDPDMTQQQATVLTSLIDSDGTGSISFDECTNMLGQMDLSSLGLDHLRIGTYIRDFWDEEWLFVAFYSVYTFIYMTRYLNLIFKMECAPVDMGYTPLDGTTPGFCFPADEWQARYHYPAGCPME